MQAPIPPVVVGAPEENPAENPRREYRQLTSEEERALLAAKRRFEETEKSNQNALLGARIVTFVAATLSFAAIKAVESNLATVALLIVGISSAVFFLFSFTSYMNPAVKIPFHMNLQFKVYEYSKLYGEFSRLVERAEGCNLNPDDELVGSIKVKMNSLIEKMEDFITFLTKINDDDFAFLEEGERESSITLYRNITGRLTHGKLLMQLSLKTLDADNFKPNQKERMIDLMTSLSKSMNELLSALNQLSPLYQQLQNH